MHEINDTECIRMILRGEKANFGFLVKKYEDKAYSLCYKILRDKEEARDSAQDAFIKAYEALPGFRLDSQFSTWFYRIIYNTCLSKIRKDRLDTGYEPDDAVWNNSGNANEAISNLDQEDMRVMLSKAYGVLNPDEIFLVEQFYREECSIEELCAMTGLSQSNVKVKLFRARQKMHGQIKSVLKEEIHISKVPAASAIKPYQPPIWLKWGIPGTIITLLIGALIWGTKKDTSQADQGFNALNKAFNSINSWFSGLHLTFDLPNLNIPSTITWIIGGGIMLTWGFLFLNRFLEIMARRDR